MIGDEKFEEILDHLLGSGDECKFCAHKETCHGMTVFSEPYCAGGYDPENYLDFDEIEKAIERGELE